jgi:hypothetical protein
MASRCGFYSVFVDAFQEFLGEGWHF